MPTLSAFTVKTPKELMVFNANADVLPGASTGQLFGAAGRCYLAPFYLMQDCNLRQMGIEIETGAAASTVRMGIYKDPGPRPLVPAGGDPEGGALIIQSATDQSTASSGVLTDTFANITSITFLRGLYWAALIGSTNATLEFYRYSTARADIMTVGITDKLRGCYFDRSGGYGALPAVCPAVTGQATEANFVFAIGLWRS